MPCRGGEGREGWVVRVVVAVAVVAKGEDKKREKKKE